MGNLNCFNRCFEVNSEVNEGLIVNEPNEFDLDSPDLDSPDLDLNNNELNIDALIDALFQFLNAQNQNDENLQD